MAMEPVEITRHHQDAGEEPELDQFYALVQMHEHTRRRWAAAVDEDVERARKLAAMRTELIERVRGERTKTGK